jgi:hypothetical protein
MEHLPSMCKALGLDPSIVRKQVNKGFLSTEMF